jgi:phosphonopyruvate decarboxylase
MIKTKEFYGYLKQKGASFFTGVPDSLLKNLCACITENSSRSEHIIAANEGNSIALAAGYHIATGKFGVVYMQNSGEGNAVNPLLSLVDEDVYRIPLLLIIGWRGEPGTKDEPQHTKQGKVTLNLLDAMGIEHLILEDDYRPQIDFCYRYMEQERRAVAVVVKNGCFLEYKIKKAVPRFGFRREDALAAILESVGNDAFFVSTTGKTSREIFELREKRGEGHTRDFLTVGSMGHTASIALGISLHTAHCVYCIDGDGSFLMHMGGLGVVAQNAMPNFKYVLINNGSHESVGGQPTIARDIDIKAILKGLGFSSVFIASTHEEVTQSISRLSDAHLSALIINVDQGSRDDLGRPTISPEQNKLDIMKLLAADSERKI